VLQLRSASGHHVGMTKSIYIIILVAGALGLSSCNTFIGLGRDVQSLGGTMVNAGNKRGGQAVEAPAQTLPPQ
tara:strand:+ start:1072 stop:1290 length:219 start_codon:yes stop_codon:yes gene_type:complete